MKLKAIYLCSGNANQDRSDIKITYNDLYIKRDIQKDWKNISLQNYDILIGTPPCNYYSKANYRKNSEYSQLTKNILPNMLKKFKNTNKPFIIENIRNRSTLKEIANWCFLNGIRIIENGRHTYFTNIYNFLPTYINIKNNNIQNKSSKNRQGDQEVKDTINQFLDLVLKEWRQ